MMMTTDYLTNRLVSVGDLLYTLSIFMFITVTLPFSYANQKLASPPFQAGKEDLRFRPFSALLDPCSFMDKFTGFCKTLSGGP